MYNYGYNYNYVVCGICTWDMVHYVVYYYVGVWKRYQEIIIIYQYNYRRKLLHAEAYVQSSTGSPSSSMVTDGCLFMSGLRDNNYCKTINVHL